MAKFVRTARIGAILFGACALIAGSALPASAASDTEVKRQESPAKVAPGAVRVCIQSEPVTGSRIARPKVCKTRDQWIKETGVDPLADR
ncbi:hypothetical protein [Sphingomonas elodea]|uniref:hypothetical protein n=1 Tax=Sphingomonas elodea TaxID=179878 RepID=UPI0002630DCA|nr:hypothetical protein [Sphingomonas elodea]